MSSLVCLTASFASSQTVEEEIGALDAEAFRHYQEGDHEKAVEVARKAVKLSSERLGEDSRSTSNMLKSLGSLFEALGRYSDAREAIERLRKIEVKLKGAGDPDVGDLLNRLGNLCKLEGNFEEAKGYYEGALNIFEEKLGVSHSDTATVLHNLGVLHVIWGNYDDAEPLFLRSLKINEEQLGPESIYTAYSLNDLGELYVNQGKFDEAELLFQRSLAIRKDQLGETHLDTAVALNSLAGLYEKLRKIDAAETLYREVLRIRETELGADHPLTGESYNNLAIIFQAQGKHSEARKLLERDLSIAVARLGKTHPGTANVLNNLASSCAEIGEAKEAEDLYKQAITIYESHFGPDHPLTTTVLDNLSMLYWKEERRGESVTSVTRSLEGKRAHLSRMLRYFPDKDSLVFQSRLFTSTQAGNSLDGRTAAREQIWFKGAVLDALNQRRVAEENLRETTNGTQLLALRDGLAESYRSHLLKEGANGTASRALETQLGEVERKIAVLLSSESPRGIEAADLPEVLEQLERGQVLVEIFRYAHVRESGGAKFRYAGVLCRKNSDPVFLALSEAGGLEETVRLYRKEIQNLASSGGKNSEAFKKAEAILYRQVLKPLESQLQEGDTIIFSLDSQLHFLPLGMLRDHEGIPFGRNYQVRYVSSGRDLLKKADHSSRKKSAFVLGNPSFRDNGPLTALAEGADNPEKAEIATNLRAGVGEDVGTISLLPLPGTAREIASLGKLLASAGYKITSLSRDEATEGNVRSTVEGHDIVHLATHGFFLSEIKRDTNLPEDLLSFGDSEQQTPVLISDPMYRSGLALAGAQSTFNLWKEGKVPPPSKDGILLAAEANLLNLRGTDLVVLSACETASGEALDGEGVMGLRRAFASAGANNTIMTLWPVNDEATVVVMEAFYEKYLNGTHPAVALAEVQNELYQPFVEKYGEMEAIARLAPFVCMSLGKVD